MTWKKFTLSTRSISLTRHRSISHGKSYNADARYCYENGKLAYSAGIYSNDTDPITQSLGDHYQAEQRWITKRILYMMSKYSFGLFSAAGTDTITVRAAGNTITYDLIPAMDMYPAIANGTSIIRGERTRAGETCSMEIELSGTGRPAERDTGCLLFAGHRGLV